MNTVSLAALPLAVMLCSCANGPLGGRGQTGHLRAATGAAVGAVAGAAVGDPFSGAAVGAVAGGARRRPSSKDRLSKGANTIVIAAATAITSTARVKPKYASKVRC